MQVLVPTIFTSAQVTSNVTETEYATWSTVTTYALGNRVIRSSFIYESLANSNLNQIPENSPLAWVKVSATNRWAMFDGRPSSSTSNTSSISVTMTVGAVTGMALLGVVGTTVTVTLGSTVLATVTVPTPTFPARSSTVIVPGLNISSGSLNVLISGTGTVTCAELIIGTLTTLGTTQLGAEVSMFDYSVKKTDSFGNLSVSPRAYSRRLRCQVTIAQSAVDTVAPLVASLRGTLCFWQVPGTFNALKVYGYVKDWSVSFADQSTTTFNLQLEGLATADTYLNPGEFAGSTGEQALSTYSVTIESSAGDQFQVGQSSSTTLSARVWRNNVEVTSSIAATHLRWRRVSVSDPVAPNSDAAFNLAHASGFKSFAVTVDTFASKATFFCEVVNSATSAVMALGQFTITESRPGLNTATVYLYQRGGTGGSTGAGYAATGYVATGYAVGGSTGTGTVPVAPSANVTYTFATGVATGLTNGWSTTIPAGTLPLYITLAQVTGTGTTATVLPAAWSSPVVLVQDGAPGANGASGLNSATVYLFQRTATNVSPAVPSASVTYTFATSAASGLTNGWSQTMPTTGGAYRWVTTGTALSTTTTDTIATTEWAAVSLLAQDGVDGAAGTAGAAGAAGTAGAAGAAGLANALVYIYQRAATAATAGNYVTTGYVATGYSQVTTATGAAPALPTATVTYTFAVASLAGLNNGWSATIPGGEGTLYVSTATASGTGTSDTIAPTEWASPVVFSETDSTTIKASNPITPSNAPTILQPSIINSAHIDRYIASSDWDGEVGASGALVRYGTRGWVLGRGSGAIGASFMEVDAATIRGKLTTNQLEVGSVNPTIMASNSQQFTPTLTWEFNTNNITQGWVGVNTSSIGASLQPTDTSLGIISVAPDPQLISPTHLNIGGLRSDKIRMRVRRAAGTTWQGACYFSSKVNSNGTPSGFIDANKVTVTDTTLGGGWVILEWDMSAMTEWTTKVIHQIRFDLASGPTTGTGPSEQFLIDWIVVGRHGSGEKRQTVYPPVRYSDSASTVYTTSTTVFGEPTIIVPIKTVITDYRDRVVLVSGAATPQSMSVNKVSPTPVIGNTVQVLTKYTVAATYGGVVAGLVFRAALVGPTGQVDTVMGTLSNTGSGSMTAVLSGTLLGILDQNLSNTTYSETNVFDTLALECRLQVIDFIDPASGSGLTTRPAGTEISVTTTTTITY